MAQHQSDDIDQQEDLILCYPICDNWAIFTYNYGGYIGKTRSGITCLGPPHSQTKPPATNQNKKSRTHMQYVADVKPNHTSKIDKNKLKSKHEADRLN